MSKFIDITGLRSGKLVALEYIGSGKWRCRCDCGNTKNVRGDHLREERVKSCGCMGYGKLIDITGKQFGDLLVIKKSETSNKRVKWLCECQICGNVFDVDSYNLRHGKANPCSCSQKDLSGENSPTYKHGDSHKRLYSIWQGMLNRCRNSNVNRYDCYGGRGISVCDEWLQYDLFREWATQNGYNDTLSIERKNVDGNYEPDNCEWIPLSEQAKNRRPRKIHNIKD